MARKTGSRVYGLPDLTIKLLNKYLLSTYHIYEWQHKQHAQRNGVCLNIVKPLKLVSYGDRVCGESAVTNTGYKGYHGYSKTNTHRIYGLEQTEGQLNQQGDQFHPAVTLSLIIHSL